MSPQSAKTRWTVPQVAKAQADGAMTAELAYEAAEDLKDAMIANITARHYPAAERCRAAIVCLADDYKIAIRLPEIPAPVIDQQALPIAAAECVVLQARVRQLEAEAANQKLMSESLERSGAESRRLLEEATMPPPNKDQNPVKRGPGRPRKVEATA